MVHFDPDLSDELHAVPWTTVGCQSGSREWMGHLLVVSENVCHRHIPVEMGTSQLAHL